MVTGPQLLASYPTEDDFLQGPTTGQLEYGHRTRSQMTLDGKKKLLKIVSKKKKPIKYIETAMLPKNIERSR